MAMHENIFMKETRVNRVCKDSVIPDRGNRGTALLITHDSQFVDTHTTYVDCFLTDCLLHKHVLYHKPTNQAVKAEVISISFCFQCKSEAEDLRMKPSLRKMCVQ